MWTGGLTPEELGRRSLESGLDCQSANDGMTEQSHKDSCDINILLARYEKNGIIPHVSSVEPNYGDFTQVRDYQSACNAIIEADEAFMGLSAQVRKRFDNDPGKLLAFLDSEDNREEAVELGILPKPVVPDATLKDVVEAVKSTKADKKPAGKPAG